MYLLNLLLFQDFSSITTGINTERANTVRAIITLQLELTIDAHRINTAETTTMDFANFFDRASSAPTDIAKLLGQDAGLDGIDALLTASQPLQHLTKVRTNDIAQVQYLLFVIFVLRRQATRRQATARYGANCRVVIALLIGCRGFS